VSTAISLVAIDRSESLFVLPIFNLQRYAPGEAFHAWHCDWTTSEEATEPIRRMIAWILICNDVPEAAPNSTGKTTTWKP
jgi:hypothetical protein